MPVHTERTEGPCEYMERKLAWRMQGRRKFLSHIKGSSSDRHLTPSGVSMTRVEQFTWRLMLQPELPETGLSPAEESGATGCLMDPSEDLLTDLWVAVSSLLLVDQRRACWGKAVTSSVCFLTARRGSILGPFPRLSRAPQESKLNSPSQRALWHAGHTASLFPFLSS